MNVRGGHRPKDGALSREKATLTLKPGDRPRFGAQVVADDDSTNEFSVPEAAADEFANARLRIVWTSPRAVRRRAAGVAEQVHADAIRRGGQEILLNFRQIVSDDRA